MKLPQIVTHDKIRDARICSLYADGKSAEEIAELHNLSSRRISTILYKNREFLKSEKDWEKIKRIAHLKRLLARHPYGLGNKSTLDIIDQLRVETEGNKLEHSGRIDGKETKVVVVIEKEVNANQSEGRRLPAQVLVE
jgi:AraC-like DNA-binding protein